MDTTFEDQIRERAYQIWQSGADGQAHDHWVWAEQAVRSQTLEASEPVVIITKAAPKMAKPRKAAVKPAAAKTASKSPKSKSKAGH